MFADDVDSVAMSLDEITYHQDFDAFELPRILRVMIAALVNISDRDRELFKYRFGLDGEEEHTWKETGTKFGISAERVRQIEARLMRMIRGKVNAKGLELRMYLQ